VSDDTGYGDLGPYGGGEGRGMPTPNIRYLPPEPAIHAMLPQMGNSPDCAGQAMSSPRHEQSK